MRPDFSVMITGEKIIRKNYLVFVNGQMRMSTSSGDYLIHGHAHLIDFLSTRLL